MIGLLTLNNHKGDAIAAFVLGHVAPARAFTQGEKAYIASRLCVDVSNLPDVATVKHFYIQRTHPSRSDCDEWQRCAPHAYGAVAVTGYIF